MGSLEYEWNNQKWDRIYVWMNYLINLKRVGLRGLLWWGVWGNDEVRIKVKRTQDYQNAAAKDFIPYHSWYSNVYVDR